MLLFNGCNENSNHTQNVSQWTLKGITYKMDTTSFYLWSLDAGDSSNHSIDISFSTKPTKSRIYRVSPALSYRDSQSPLVQIVEYW